jgi:hypothetical protein
MNGEVHPRVKNQIIRNSYCFWSEMMSHDPSKNTDEAFKPGVDANSVSIATSDTDQALGGGPQVKATERKRTLRGGVDPHEAARLSHASRAERKAQREQAKSEAAATAATSALTARQRLGIAVSKLDQSELDAIVKKLSLDAQAGDTRAIHALARILDQSFGRAAEEAPTDGKDPLQKEWDTCTPAEKAAIVAMHKERIRRQAQAANDTSDPRDEAGSSVRVDPGCICGRTSPDGCPAGACGWQDD